MAVPFILLISFPYLFGSLLFNVPILVMGIVLLTVYTGVVFFRPTIALVMFILTLAFHDFLNLPLTQGGLKLSTAILLSAFIITLARILIKRDPDLFMIPSRIVNILVPVFLLVMLISLVNSQNIQFSKVEIQKFVYCVIVYFFVAFTVKEASLLKKVAVVLVCGGIAASLLGVVEAKTGTIYGLLGNQSLLGGGVPEATLIGPGNRINGVLGDADLHGMYMGVVFSFALCLYFVYKRRFIRLLLVATMLLCLFNIIGAASRGAALGSFISFLVFWFLIPLRRKWLTATGLLGGMFVFACIVFILFPHLYIERFYRPEGQAKETLTLRKNNVLIGLAMAVDHPVIGHGPGGFSINYHKYASSTIPTAKKKTTRPLNVYIQVLVEYGIVGFSLFLGILFSALKMLFPLARSDLGAFDIYAATVFATLCGYCTFMLFTGLINDQNFWLLVALAVTLGTVRTSAGMMR